MLQHILTLRLILLYREVHVKRIKKKRKKKKKKKKNNRFIMKQLQDKSSEKLESSLY